MKKILDKLMLLGIAIAILVAIAGVAWYIATSDLREIEKRTNCCTTKSWKNCPIKENSSGS